MAASNFISPLGGYNAASVDYVAPQTNYGIITGLDKDDGTGTAWWGVNNSTHALLIDKITEYTPAAGLTVNGVAFPSSGTYTPTLFNTANLAGSAAYLCQYMRVGSTVTVSGAVSVDPTTTSVLTQLGISLPVASDFATNQNLGGVAFASNVLNEGAAIYGDTANDRALMQWIAGDVTNHVLFFSFTYQVI